MPTASIFPANSVPRIILFGLNIPVTNLMKKGLNVTLFPTKNSKILAEKIIALIENKQSEEIKKENYKIIKENYNYNKNMEKIERLYEDLIEKYKK